MTLPQEEKNELHKLVNALIPFGEDEKELHFWEAIFEDLSPEHRTAVLANLREELAALTHLNEVKSRTEGRT